MSRPPHLYVVEDDRDLRSMLCAYFARYGIKASPMSSAEEMFAKLALELPDLIVLDVGLPGQSGLGACEQLRRRGDPVGVILLTARTDEVDRVVGLEMGADDYVSKPFSARELLARARAVLRRSSSGAQPVKPPAPADAVRIGDWTYLPTSRSLHRGQEMRILNTVEQALLATLTATPGKPVTRERLLAASHEKKDAGLLRAVDAAIMRLRRVVESVPSNPRYIKTVRFHGYMFVPDLVELTG